MIQVNFDSAGGKVRSATVTIEEAQARLPGLIATLKPGEELVITQQDQPVARLVPELARPSKRQRQPGLAKGQLIIVKEDDSHLEDFREYM